MRRMISLNEQHGSLPQSMSLRHTPPGWKAPEVLRTPDDPKLVDHRLPQVKSPTRIICSFNGCWLGPFAQVMAVMTTQEMGWCQRLFLIRIIRNKGEGSVIDASFNFMESCLQLSSCQTVPAHCFSLELISQIWQVFPTTLPTKASWVRWIAILV